MPRWHDAESRSTQAWVAAAFLTILLCVSYSARATALQEAQDRRDADIEAGQPLIAHVVVALCDNESQGIVPVPARLGNGNDPANNLYWGAMYGVRSYFRRSSEWRSLPIGKSADARVLDRALFSRELLSEGRRVEILLLAEAWQGNQIAASIEHFLAINRGEHVESLRVGDRDVAFGGASHVIAFVGHNGLMDFQAPELPRSAVKPRAHASMVLACLSQDYFSVLLKPYSAPLLTTRGLMAPEAYTLDAALTSWFSGEPASAVQLAAARAYAHYQKTSERAALRLFAVPKE